MKQQNGKSVKNQKNDCIIDGKPHREMSVIEPANYYQALSILCLKTITLTVVIKKKETLFVQYKCIDRIACGTCNFHYVREQK